MTISLDRKPDCLAELTLHSDEAEVGKERKDILKAFAKQAKIPGFRPGKVPAKVLEKRFGGDIKGELENRLVQAGIDQAVRDEELALLDVTSVTEQTFADDGTFSCKAELILRPEFTLPDYQTIELEKPESDITDAEVEEALDNVRERFAEFEPLEDTEAEEGHLAVIDYTGSLDGKPVTETIEKAPPYVSGREDHWLRLQIGQFLPGFSEGLIGAKASETREIEVTFDEEFPISDLHGKTVHYTVTIKELKKSVLPELNDEFAKNWGEDETVETLRQRVVDSLHEQAEMEAQRELGDQVVQWLDEHTEMELPAIYLEQESANRAQQLMQQQLQQGVPFEAIEADQENLKEQADLQAKTSLKMDFILQDIAKKEEIEVSREAIFNRVAALAQQQGEKPEAFLKKLQKENRLQGLHHSLLVEETMRFLIEKNSDEDSSEQEAEILEESSKEESTEPEASGESEEK